MEDIAIVFAAINALLALSIVVLKKYQNLIYYLVCVNLIVFFIVHHFYFYAVLLSVFAMLTETYRHFFLKKDLKQKRKDFLQTLVIYSSFVLLSFFTYVYSLKVDTGFSSLSDVAGTGDIIMLLLICFSVVNFLGKKIKWNG